MTNSTTNQVRQILMNELGLTRASIRAEVDKIVVETVEKRVDALLRGGHLTREVNAAIERMVETQYYSRDALRREIAKAASAAIMERVYIDIGKVQGS